MERKEIKFYEDTLLGVKDDDGKVWLAVKKSCLNIGLTEAQSKAEVQKVESSMLFAGNWFKFKPVQTEGTRAVRREVVMIAEKFVPMWFAQINLTPAMQKKNPDAVQKLLRYQLEAADVLHKAFYETDGQKSIFHEKMGLEGQIQSLEKKLEMTVVQLNNVEETLDYQNERLNAVMDNMTLTTVQQGRLQRAVKDRVRVLLGGAHSQEYKENSHMYFINFWNNIKKKFNCGSRWQDLNPAYFNATMDYISDWKFTE